MQFTPDAPFYTDILGAPSLLPSALGAAQALKDFQTESQKYEQLAQALGSQTQQAQGETNKASALSGQTQQTALDMLQKLAGNVQEAEQPTLFGTPFDFAAASRAINDVRGNYGATLAGVLGRALAEGAAGGRKQLEEHNTQQLSGALKTLYALLQTNPSLVNAMRGVEATRQTGQLESAKLGTETKRQVAQNAIDAQIKREGMALTWRKFLADTETQMKKLAFDARKEESTEWTKVLMKQGDVAKSLSNNIMQALSSLPMEGALTEVIDDPHTIKLLGNLGITDMKSLREAAGLLRQSALSYMQLALPDTYYALVNNGVKVRGAPNIAVFRRGNTPTVGLVLEGSDVKEVETEGGKKVRLHEYIVFDHGELKRIYMTPAEYRQSVDAANGIIRAIDLISARSKNGQKD